MLAVILETLKENQKAIIMWAFFGIGAAISGAFLVLGKNLGGWIWKVATKWVWKMITKPFRSKSHGQVIDGVMKNLDLHPGDIARFDISLKPVHPEPEVKVKHAVLAQPSPGNEEVYEADGYDDLDGVDADDFDPERALEPFTEFPDTEREMAIKGKQAVEAQPVEPLTQEEFVERIIEVNDRLRKRWFNDAVPTYTKADGRNVLRELIAELNQIIPRLVDKPTEGRKAILEAIVSTAGDRLKETPLGVPGQDVPVFFSLGVIPFNMLQSHVEMWKAFEKKTGPLPKRIKPEDLNMYGFSVVNTEQAKHKEYNSYRWHCYRCKEWVNTTTVTKYGSKDGLPHKYCSPCFGKTSRTDYQLV